MATLFTASSDLSAVKNGTANKLALEDRAAHDWYRFVLSFPAHLVREYIERFSLNDRCLLLDPFCGTGTTLVEGKRLGIPSVGIEAHPMSHFASMTKIDWEINPGSFLKIASEIQNNALKTLRKDGLRDEPCSKPQGRNLRTLPAEKFKLLLTNSISPVPLHKILVLVDGIDEAASETSYPLLRLALAKAAVATASNLHFGPEVGVTTPKIDAPVVLSWFSQVEIMANDLYRLHAFSQTPAIAHKGDSRQILSQLKPESVDAVITSPPYPNEKDYTRTTRLESVLLGFIRNKDELRTVKEGLIRSNTRSVYKADDDHLWVEKHREVHRIADAIEARRKELGKTSGFERMYPRLTKLYFGGMARHLAQLRCVLKPGAHLAYVVGDQASYLRVMIRTGQLLAEIAETLGYEVEAIDLFRTRLSTATKEQLREEVVVLRWPGRKHFRA